MVLVWGSGSACSNANSSLQVAEMVLKVDASTMTSAQGSLNSMVLNFDNRNDHASAIVCFRLEGSNELFPPTADTPPVVLVQPKLSTLDYFPVLPLRGPLNGSTRLLLSDEAMRKDLSSTSTRQVMFILTSQVNSTVNCDLSDSRLVGISPVQMSDSAISAVYLPNVTITSGILQVCISVSTSKDASFVPADARVVVSSAGLDEKSYVLRLWYKETALSTPSNTSSSSTTAVMECKDSPSYVTKMVANELVSLGGSSGVEVTEVSKIGNAIFTIAVGVTGSTSCLLYTSDAADEEDSVDLGGRRIIKKKKIGQSYNRR
eukprot:TRINITY_DN12874_c0_g1_i3.p1 TRINITY_DN12874_c0_g1~~TRINITY_DN12874_c0_g1_i3.p1  ORF type:complete len:318 (-),score=39.00 TRINITY_DN12874_c0_g1_i3:78-1031(-)